MQSKQHNNLSIGSDSLGSRFLKSTGTRAAGIILGALLLIGVQIYADQNKIVVDQFEVALPQIPMAFDGYKIVHLSDLHGVAFKDGQATLIRKIEAEHPDMIVISGDTLDRHLDRWHNSLDLIRTLALSTPVYITTGNHEARVSLSSNALDELRRTGAILLENESVKLHPPGVNSFGASSKNCSNRHCAVRLFGINDPMFFRSDNEYIDTLAYMKRSAELIDKGDCFSMLISHRPELQKLYSDAGYDLTFSGHAHGGQVRLPFTEGLIAPNQGLFPKLTAGLHVDHDNYLLISRGLGNPSGIPRVFNPPEVVSLTLRHKTPDAQ